MLVASGGYEALSQFEFLNFAYQNFEQFLKNNQLGRFEPCESFANKGDQFFFGGAGSREKFDEGAGHLAPFVIGFGVDGAEGHGRMGHECAFDFNERDIFTTRNDDVLGAIRDLDVSVRVLDCDVA